MLRACRQIQPDEVYLLSVTFIVFQARRKKQGKVRQDESTEGSSALGWFSRGSRSQRPKGGSCAGMKLAKGAGYYFSAEMINKFLRKGWVNKHIFDAFLDNDKIMGFAVFSSSFPFVALVL